MTGYVSYVKVVRDIMPKLLPAKDLGKRIRRLREDRGWTQPEFARKSGRDQAEISKWENGRIQPSYDTVVILAQALGVDEGEFLEGSTSTTAMPRPDAGSLPPWLQEAWVADARAAEKRAAALVEFAVAARLAEENARDRQRMLSPDAEALRIAAQGREAIELVEREESRKGLRSSDTPPPATPDRPATGSERGTADQGRN